MSEALTKAEAKAEALELDKKLTEIPGKVRNIYLKVHKWLKRLQVLDAWKYFTIEVDGKKRQCKTQDDYLKSRGFDKMRSSIFMAGNLAEKHKGKLSEEDLSSISFENSKMLLLLPESTRYTPAIIKAAKTLEPKKFREQVNKDHQTHIPEPIRLLVSFEDKAKCQDVDQALTRYAAEKRVTKSEALWEMLEDYIK